MSPARIQIENGRRRCTKCQEEKPLTDFYKEKRSPTGHQSACKACADLRISAYHASHPDQRRKTTKRWVERHRELRQKSVHDYYERNSEKVRLKNDRLAKQRHDETRPRATRHYQEWTGPELEIVSRGDLTLREMARMTGRTYKAVVARRHLMKLPLMRALNGEQVF